MLYKENNKQRFFFICTLIIFFTLRPGAVLSNNLSNQDAELVWLEGEGEGQKPIAVSGDEAIFQIKLIDDEAREPENHEVWIDADKSGEYEEDEKTGLIPIDPNAPAPLAQGRIYTTVLHFRSDGKIGSGKISEESNLAGTFNTKFCFYFTIQGSQVKGSDLDDHDPADPNNQLLILSPKSDTDGDDIPDSEEWADLLPESYWEDPNQGPSFAYNDDTLASLMTIGGKITMKIDQGRFRKVSSVEEDDPNRPERTISDLAFPYGFVSFRIEAIPKGEKDLVFKVLFPNKITSYAEFWRYHSDDWYARIANSPIYGEYDDGKAWRYESFSENKEFFNRSLMLKLEDNNPLYDSDDTERVIEDPWGLGIPKGSGEGRCFIQMFSWKKPF